MASDSSLVPDSLLDLNSLALGLSIDSSDLDSAALDDLYYLSALDSSLGLYSSSDPGYLLDPDSLLTLDSLALDSHIVSSVLDPNEIGSQRLAEVREDVVPPDVEK